MRSEQSNRNHISQRVCHSPLNTEAGGVIYGLCQVFQYSKEKKNDVSSNQPLALCRWHTLLKKMLNSSDNSKPAGESFLWVCLKTSTKIYLAERANKCLSNIDDQREARNATWWQNVKIIYSGPSAARHNPTCSARQPAIKHCYPNL